MNFDALAPDFTEYTSYTENGITLAATLPPNHFHAVSTPDLSSTAAEIHSLDGVPERITFGGALFNLQSLDLVTVDSGVTVSFKSSSGGTATETSAGTIVFGAGFSGVSWVELDFGAVPDGSFDSVFTVDNINVSAVPEPGEWSAIAALGLAAAAGVRRFRKNA